MTRQIHSDDELSALFSAVCDERVTDEELQRLESGFSKSEESRSAYLQWVRLHVALRFREHAESGLREFVKSMSVSDGHDTKAAPVPAGTTSSMPPSPRSKSLLDRMSRHQLPSSFGITLAIFVAVIVGLAFTPVGQWIAEIGKKDAQPRQPAVQPEFVAWYMGAHNAEWLDGTEPEKTRLKLGQQLAIAKGLIEIQYVTGAKVVIEGPAVFYVGTKSEGTKSKGTRAQATEPAERARKEGEGGSLRAANSGFLALGKLVARVKGKKAEGFTINTPSGRVEDLGTEFGVEVLSSGAEEFVVLSGKVDVVREASGGRPRQRIRLTKDQGAFVAARGGTITRRAKVDVALLAAYRKQLVEKLSSSGPVLPSGPGDLGDLPVTRDLALWLAADYGVIADRSGRVRVWQDRAAGMKATVPDANSPDAKAVRPPTWIASAINGQSAVRFDGVSTSLVAPGISLDGGATVFVVFRVAAFPKDARPREIVDANGCVLDIMSEHVVRGRLWGGRTSGIVSAPIDNKQAFLATYRFRSEEAAGAELFLNGRTQGTADALTARNRSPSVSIGAHPGHVGHFNGDLGELLVFAAALSDDEIHEIEKYLASKYEIEK